MINGTINDTVETRCMQYEELLHGLRWAHTREDLDEYTCWKPECRVKHAKKELSDRLVGDEMLHVYTETSQSAKQVLAEKEKKKKKDNEKKANL